MSGKLKKKQQQQDTRLRQQKHRAAKKLAAAAEALPSATEATSTTQITTSRKLTTEQKEKKRVYYRDYRRNARMNRTRQKVVADRLIDCNQRPKRNWYCQTNHHHPPIIIIHPTANSIYTKAIITTSRTSMCKEGNGVISQVTSWICVNIAKCSEGSTKQSTSVCNIEEENVPDTTIF